MDTRTGKIYDRKEVEEMLKADQLTQEDHKRYFRQIKPTEK